MKLWQKDHFHFLQDTKFISQNLEPTQVGSLMRHSSYIKPGPYGNATNPTPRIRQEICTDIEKLLVWEILQPQKS